MQSQLTYRIKRKILPRNKAVFLLLIVALFSMFAFRVYWINRYYYQGVYSPPLSMRGGSPYIRALMRTISASESNSNNPYAALYGGTLFNNYSRHPNICNTISTHVNQGNCSTAAGRYQLLQLTWLEKAKKYHPEAGWFSVVEQYDFSPINQDVVVYHWLVDKSSWRMNIASELAHGQINKVLKRLSGTWTSLGYGIENNKNSKLLPKIYQQILKEEIATAKNNTQFEKTEIIP